MTVLFSLCWLGDTDQERKNRLERNLNWLEYNRAIKNELGYDKIILLDNASLLEDLNKLNTSIYTEDGAPIKEIESDTIVYRFNNHLPRVNMWTYHYQWRGMEYLQNLIPKKKINKLLLIDTDMYVLTSRMAHYIRDLNTGWWTVWCKKYGFPETALHVVCNDAISSFLSFPIPSWSHYDGKVMENLMPFTHIEKNMFKGDRYGEILKKQEPEDDFYGQWINGCDKMVYK